MNRKAFVFSIISVMIIFTALILTAPSPFTAETEIQEFYERRITQTNTLVGSFRGEFMDALISAGARTSFDLLTQYRDVRGLGLYASRAEMEGNFTRILLMGEAYNPGIGSYEDVTAVLGVSGAYSFQDIMNEYVTMLQEYYQITIEYPDNLPADLVHYDIRLYQNATTGPYAVGIEMRMPFNVSAGRDMFGNEIGRWALDETFTVYVPIMGLRDPYLLILSDGDIDARIQDFFTIEWNRGIFQLFLDEEGYVKYNESMSFLGRYSADMIDASCCGIVTAIGPARYAAHTSLTRPASGDFVSYVDCGYFPFPASTPISCIPGTLVFEVIDITDQPTYPLTIHTGIAEPFFNLTSVDLTNPITLPPIP